ncbi:MAG TPA: DOMON-like domain-containing protein [Allosphingosinicella sp.]|nr:DOMON-like domain-containing protein [Allosphingosinicella sp.]
MTFRLPGDTSMVELPVRIEPRVKQSERRRADRLWEHTCFECFVRPEGEAGYLEFNFSPSMEWAAYRFDDYRENMRDADVTCPAIVATARPNRFEISVRIDLPPEWKGRCWRAGFAAVIEEKDRTKSYWALAHPPGDPDFHHPDCFALELPAPDAP